MTPLTDDIIFEEQFRGEFPSTGAEVPRAIAKELQRVSPGYEFLHHCTGVWVLYRVHPGASPSQDLLIKQCEMPHKYLSFDVFRYLSEQDRGEETFKQWMAGAEERYARAFRRRKERLDNIALNLASDTEHYVRRGRKGVLV